MRGDGTWRPEAVQQALQLLLRGAAPGDVGRVHRRLGGTTVTGLLSHGTLPARVRWLAAVDPDPAVRRALVLNRRLETADLLLLLARPDPVVGTRAFAHPAADVAVRRSVLAAGRHGAPAEGPHPLAEVHATVLGSKDPRVAGAGVVADVPEVVRHALCAGGPDLAAAEQARAVLNLLDHGGPAALSAVLGRVEGLRPEVAALARAAVDGVPGARDRLAAAVSAAEGTSGLIAELREGRPDALVRRGGPGLPLSGAVPARDAAPAGDLGSAAPPRAGAPSAGQGIVWEDVAAAHAERPFPRAAAVLLAGHPGCPRPLLRALFSAHPAPVAAVAPGDREIVALALRTPGQPGLTKAVTAAARAGVLTAADSIAVVTTAAPASTALGLVPELPPATAVAELIDRHLGTDARRWEAARAALGTFKGTLPELLAAAAAAPWAGAEHHPADAPARLSKAYRMLLLTARQETLAAVLPALPDVMLRDLLSAGSLPDHVVEAAIGAEDPRVWRAIGANATLDARVLARIVAHDDPAAGAAVYRNPRATASLRRAIVGGRPLSGGRGRRPAVPLDPGLRAELLVTGERRELCPLLASSDPELVARAVGFGVRMVAQRHVLLRAWEERGEAAARELFARLEGSLGEAVKRAFARACSAGGGAAGLAVLREGSEAYDDPATLPGLLSVTRGTSSIRDLLNEPYAHDWPAIVAAHRRRAFMPQAAEELARHEEASDDERRMFRLVVVNDLRPRRDRSGRPEAPVHLLREGVLSGSAAAWLEAAVREGFVTGAEVLAEGRGCAEMVRVLTRFAEAEVPADDLWTALDALVAERLAGHPDAWAVALRLLEDFTGTLPELAALAAQVAGPAPSPEEDEGETASADGSGAEPEAGAEPGAEAGAAAKRPAPPGRGGPLWHSRSALAAVEALRGLAPGGPPPAPDDPEVLRRLVWAPAEAVPGGVPPSWLREAVEACPDPAPRAALAQMSPDPALVEDLMDRGEEEVLDAVGRNHAVTAEVRHRAAALAAGRRVPRVTAPGTQAAPPPVREVLERARETLAKGQYHAPGTVTAAWLDGRVTVAALVSLLPLARAPRTTWLSQPGFAGPAAAVHRRLLRDALGEAAGPWLRLLAAACGPDGDRPLGEVLSALAAAPPGGPAPRLDDLVPERPRTPEQAEAFLSRRGGWRFPGAHLLVQAPAATGVAVLGALAPEAAWLFAASADPLPAEVARHVAATGDPVALRGMALAAPRLPADVVATMLERGGRDVEVALFRHGGAGARRAVLARSDVAPAVRATITSPACPPQTLDLCLDAADPDLVEHAAGRLRRGLGVSEQLRACEAVLCGGGPARLRAFVGSGVLGASVSAAAAKALESADPAEALRRRAARETSPSRLAGRLRRRGAHAVAYHLAGSAGSLDLAGLLAEHRREPFANRVLEPFAERDDAPLELVEEAVRLAPHARAAELVDRHPAAVRALARRGLGRGCAAIAELLDGALSDGRLTGLDLVREAHPADEVMRYVAQAVSRPELPERARTEAGTARAEITRLLGSLTGPAAWSWVYEAVSGAAAGWDEAPIAAVLEHAATL